MNKFEYHRSLKKCIAEAYPDVNVESCVYIFRSERGFDGKSPVAFYEKLNLLKNQELNETEVLDFVLTAGKLPYWLEISKGNADQKVILEIRLSKRKNIFNEKLNDNFPFRLKGANSSTKFTCKRPNIDYLKVFFVFCLYAFLTFAIPIFSQKKIGRSFVIFFVILNIASFLFAIFQRKYKEVVVDNIAGTITISYKSVFKKDVTEIITLKDYHFALIGSRSGVEAKIIFYDRKGTSHTISGKNYGFDNDLITSIEKQL